MSRRLGATLLFLVPHLAYGASTPPMCPAGAPIGSVDLRVESARGGDPLPLRTINRIGPGDIIRYRPINRGKEARKGEVAMVLVRADRGENEDPLEVLDPKDAGSDQEWKVPHAATVAAYVYGPNGLSRSKVKSFLTRDQELVSQLADYAEKTTQTEALLQLLSSRNSSAESVNAALSGFASQYGFSARLDRTATPEQNAMVLFQSLNPAIASYDPLSPEYSQRISQTAGMATSVAALFFGSPVGLAAGGTAMLMEVRSLIFPDTVFRSSFAQKLPDEGLMLCGRNDAIPAHTRVAFLWATRIPNTGAPDVKITDNTTLPVKLRASLPVKVGSDNDWRYLDRARNWVLEGHGRVYRAEVRKLGDPKAIEVDLTGSQAPPGVYHLAAFWDWEKFHVGGDVMVLPLSDFRTARLEAESQDRLTERSGKVPVSMEGDDFEFVTKVELKKPGDPFFGLKAVPFALPTGPRQGPQMKMDVQVDTADLAPGHYQLAITQVDGKPYEVPALILPPVPSIQNFPVSMNAGQKVTAATLTGDRLNLVGKIEMQGLAVKMEPASSDGKTRQVHIEAQQDFRPGERVEARVWVENRTQPVIFQSGLQINGPLPRITDSRFSLPPDLDISVNPGELPASYFVSAMLQVENLKSDSVLHLRCGDSQPSLSLGVGERKPNGSLERLGSGELFATFDNGTFINGCPLTATVENRGEGESAPYSLGRVLRIPKIESLTVESSTEPNGPLTVTMTGRDLETIQAFGWDPDHSLAVSDLPTPIPGEGQKQLLKSALPGPRPSSSSPLYVWLRGENTGRAVEIKVETSARTTGSR